MLYVTHVRLCIFFLCEVCWKKVKFLHQFQVRLSKRIRMILTWLNYSHTDRIYACISIKKSSLWIEPFPFFLCWFQRSCQHWLKRSKMTTNVFFSILLCWTHKSLSGYNNLFNYFGIPKMIYPVALNDTESKRLIVFLE